MSIDEQAAGFDPDPWEHALATILNAVASGELAKSGWQPIATAPRDGTRVDLWMVDQDGDCWREADAYYVTQGIYELLHYTPESGFGRGKYAKRDGWFAPGHDYDDADGWCDVPAFYNANPRQKKTIFTLPTHWMQLPQPPALADHGPTEPGQIDG